MTAIFYPDPSSVEVRHTQKQKHIETKMQNKNIRHGFGNKKNKWSKTGMMTLKEEHLTNRLKERSFTKLKDPKI